MGLVANRRAAIARHHRVEVEHEGWADGAMRPLDIRSGDTVEVISGKDKGKRGIVERVQVERQRIVIRGVNLMKRHTKANTQGNVQLVCSRCEKKTRIAHQVTEEGVRVMICRKCGERYERVTG